MKSEVKERGGDRPRDDGNKTVTEAGRLGQWC